MSAKEVPLIRKAILDVNDSSEGSLCASFEVPGERKAWVQSLVDTLNIHWPYNENPMLGLGRLELDFPPHFELTSWEPNAYATFIFRPYDSEDHARFIDALFTRVYECPEDGYPLDIKIYPI